MKLNRNRIANALLYQLENMPKKELGEILARKFAVDELDALINAEAKLTYSQLRRDGGAHLSAVRDWMQRRAFNGEDVRWGSEDVLTLKSYSVREFEELAAQIASAALLEFLDAPVMDDLKVRFAAVRDAR